jgi:hypothetical protein
MGGRIKARNLGARGCRRKHGSAPPLFGKVENRFGENAVRERSDKNIATKSW